MKRTNQISREAWQEHIRDWEGSELTQMEYCRRKGLSIMNFRYWRSRLRKETTSDVKMFQEIATFGLNPEPMIEIRLEPDWKVSIRFRGNLSFDLVGLK